MLKSGFVVAQDMKYDMEIHDVITSYANLCKKENGICFADVGQGVSQFVPIGSLDFIKVTEL